MGASLFPQLEPKSALGPWPQAPAPDSADPGASLDSSVSLQSTRGPPHPGSSSYHSDPRMADSGPGRDGPPPPHPTGKPFNSWNSNLMAAEICANILGRLKLLALACSRSARSCQHLNEEMLNRPRLESRPWRARSPPGRGQGAVSWALLGTVEETGYRSCWRSEINSTLLPLGCGWIQGHAAAVRSGTQPGQGFRVEPT